MTFRKPLSFWRKLHEWVTNMASPAASFTGGFIGGFAALFCRDFYAGVYGHLSEDAIQAADVVAVANTYIVYTTLIFGSVAVLMAFLALYFGWKFATDQARILTAAQNQLLALLRQDLQFGVDIVAAAIENEDARKHMDDTIVQRVEEYLRTLSERKSADAQAVAGLVQAAADKGDGK